MRADDRSGIDITPTGQEGDQRLEDRQAMDDHVL
jgi:hypothetical protein